jgi:hypothetical protein
MECKGRASARPFDSKSAARRRHNALLPRLDAAAGMSPEIPAIVASIATT